MNSIVLEIVQQYHWLGSFNYSKTCNLHRLILKKIYN